MYAFHLQGQGNWLELMEGWMEPEFRAILEENLLPKLVSVSQLTQSLELNPTEKGLNFAVQQCFPCNLLKRYQDPDVQSL